MLKIFKIYIKINLVNSFICLFKFLAKTLILFVQKLDGIFHLYIDYQNLNNLTIENQYSLALIDKLFNQLGYIKQFIWFNLINIYHQIKIKKYDKQKTAFKIRYGHFEYQIMLFSLSNTLTSFQSYINKILAKKFNIFVIVYIDDIFIYIKKLGQPKLIYYIKHQIFCKNIAFLPILKSAILIKIRSISWATLF